MDQSQKNAEKIRFTLVGIANTAIDFGILFTLTFLGLDKILANYVSTSFALVFSFFANKSFTFKDTGSSTKKQLLIFIVVTLAGLWIIQPIIIWGVTSSLSEIIKNEVFLLFAAKVIATIASLSWNYVFYSRLVFRTRLKG